jgi:hypothetical protein
MVNQALGAAEPTYGTLSLGRAAKSTFVVRQNCIIVLVILAEQTAHVDGRFHQHSKY